MISIQKTSRIKAGGLCQDLVFRPEASQRCDARQSKRTDQVNPESDLHTTCADRPYCAYLAGRNAPRLQPAFLFCIVLGLMLCIMLAALHALDDRASRQEQQCLEGVRDQVEHPGNVHAHPDRRHHKAELADGGVRQDFLDIVLSHADGRHVTRLPHPSRATPYVVCGTRCRAAPSGRPGRSLRSPSSRHGSRH